MLGRDNLIGRGVGDIVVVGLGNNNDCKGRLDGGGVVGEEYEMGKKGDMEKIQKVMETVLERNQEIEVVVRGAEEGMVLTVW